MQETLRKTIRNILMPLIRTLIRNGMSYGEFDKVARKCFVDVGFSDFADPKKKQTVSNVAILTGLYRKEVKRLHELDADDPVGSGERQYNRVVRVLSGWINDPRFLREDGNPKDLDYDGENSFSELVREYSGDMPIAAMQKVMAASGNIRFVDGGKLRLLTHAYLPSDDPQEKLEILGADTRELIETIDFNLTAKREDLRFQRKASNPTVDPNAIPQIKQFMRRKGQAFLEEVDLYLAQHETSGNDGIELSVGVYYHEPEDDGRDDSA